MKEKDTIIITLNRYQDAEHAEVKPNKISGTRTWRILCDALTLLLAFLSMSALTVVTIVFVVTTMAHTQVTPASDLLYGDLAAHAHQPGSRLDHWPYPEMLTLGPTSPDEVPDEFGMYVYDQGFEPTWSW